MGGRRRAFDHKLIHPSDCMILLAEILMISVFFFSMTYMFFGNMVRGGTCGQCMMVETCIFKLFLFVGKVNSALLSPCVTFPTSGLSPPSLEHGGLCCPAV